MYLICQKKLSPQDLALLAKGIYFISQTRFRHVCSKTNGQDLDRCIHKTTKRHKQMDKMDAKQNEMHNTRHNGKIELYAQFKCENIPVLHSLS